jgi:arylsulfatase
MSLYRFAATLFLLFLITGCENFFSRMPETIILITIDTLRPDHLSCYNYSRNTSPNIDRFTKEGILYRNCFATASATAPSIGSILTSRYSSQNGFTAFYLTKLDDSETTIAELLSEKGYTCAAFIGNPVIYRDRNTGQGFDLYDDELPQKELNRRMPERIADPLTDAAIRWLESTSGRRFLWLHYQDPHGPYYPPEKWRGSFIPGKSEFENKILPVLKDYSGYGGIPAYQKLFQHRDAGHYLAMYDSEILYLDNSIGRFFNDLKEKGLYKRSLIFLTADHGEAFGENNYYFAHGHKSTPDQTHVPLISKMPGNKVRDKEVYRPVSTLDIFPTILSQTQQELPKNIAGRCLPEFPSYKEEKRMFFSETRWHYAVISDDHYYTRDKPHLKGKEVHTISGGVIYPMAPLLFDIKKDEIRLNENQVSMSDQTKEMDQALSVFYQAPGKTPHGEIPEKEKRILRSLGYIQ